MRVIDLNVVHQNHDFDCGPTALHSVFAYYGEDVTQEDLIDELETTEDGTSLKNMIRVAKEHGFKVKAGRATYETVRSLVGRGFPVIVLVQAWAERLMTLEDWEDDWEDGHYVVVIGIDDGVVVFEDPSSTRRTRMKKDEFLARWHDVDSITGRPVKNFAMVVYGRKPARKTEHMD